VAEMTILKTLKNKDYWQL